MTRSNIFLVLLVSFVLGIGTGSFVFIPGFFLFTGAILCLTLVVIFRKRKNIKVLGICFVFFILGTARFQLSEKQVENISQSSEATGVIYEEPERSDNQKIKIRTEEGENILITAFLYPEYIYGDKIKVYGKIEPPENFEGFDYKSYLKRYGIYLVSYRPKIELVSSGHGNVLLDKIYKTRTSLSGVIKTGLAEPENSIFQAMALGLKKGITPETRDYFAKAGISHIIAISGLHITIIAGILMNLALGLYLSRKQAFWFASLGLLLFILLVGAPASAVRAGTMGFLVLLAMYLGRLSHSANAFILAGALMLAVNPKLLRWDIGFQLSFLAVLGLIYIGPHLESFLKKVPDFLNIKSTILMTLSAQIFTLPLIIYYFERFSLIAPVANILVLPVLPFILISGFAASFTSLVYLPLSQIVFLPCYILLKFVSFTAKFLANLNWSSFEIENLDFLFILLVYIFIFVFLKIIKKPNINVSAK